VSASSAAPDAGAASAVPERLSERGRRARRPTGDDRERAILATAERLLGERGVRDISVDDLARGAGISRSSFYFYFPSKEAVVLTLLDRVAEEARTRRAAALEAAGDRAPDLWRLGVATILDTFRAHRSVMLAVSQMVGESEEIAELWGQIIDGFVADTTAGIEAERDRGVALAGPPARQLAIALSWMNERLLHTAMSGQNPCVDEDEAVELILTVWSRVIYGNDSLGGDP
jgi:AcrR family transcriptional regulator